MSGLFKGAGAGRTDGTKPDTGHKKTRPTLGPMALAERIGTLAGGSRVVQLEQLFDVFGVERGNWRALSLRLTYGRWPDTIVIDPSKAGRPPDRDVAVEDQVFIQEIAGIQRGCRDLVRQLLTAGHTIPRVVADNKIPTSQVKRIQKGEGMSDRAAVQYHLSMGGALRGLDDEEIKKRVGADATRHSRAIKKYGRPK